MIELKFWKDLFYIFKYFYSPRFFSGSYFLRTSKLKQKHHWADLKIQQSELLLNIRAENSKLEDIWPGLCQLHSAVWFSLCSLQPSSGSEEKLEVQRSIEDLNIQITTFLLSDTAAKVFPSWAEDHSYGNQPLDIDTIITIVDKLWTTSGVSIARGKKTPNPFVLHNMKILSIPVFQKVVSQNNKLVPLKRDSW